MQLNFAGNSHFTYCTNIHPGETLDEIVSNLTRFAVPIKRQLSPEQPFGVGLRLSWQATQELLNPVSLDNFRRFCRRYKLYIFTINGFIYGQFHGTQVKENVYLPDWRDSKRLRFSNDIAYILARLLPEEYQTYGSVSTVPCGFKNCIKTEQDITRVRKLLIEHISKLHQIYEKMGKNICLALEPEPGCFLETIDEVVEFFQHHIFSPPAIDQLYDLIGHSREYCEQFIRDHLGICYDTCHMAIEYENPQQALEKLKQAQISIFKIQISSALKIHFQSSDPTIPTLLAPFCERIYLHQVVEKKGTDLHRYTDLPDALANLSKLPDQTPVEWRIHFHIPIFLEKAGVIDTTQQHIIKLISQLKNTNLCQHYEVETYTWDVLPPEYRNTGIIPAITRELEWARNCLLKPSN